MSELGHLEWEIPYKEALLEEDEEKLKEKILLAEWKIFERLQHLSSDDDHHDERQVIADAVNNLLRLKQEKLRYPGLSS